MDTFDSVLERFALISYVDLIDILLVTLIIFGVLMLIRGTRAVQVLRGLLVLAAFVFILAQIFELQAFTWLVDNMLPVLLIAIPVIFQPELRRALEQLGLAGRYLRIFRRDESNPVVDAFKDAALRLSQRRHGALVVFEQDTGLQEYIDTGVVLDADPSAELFLTIFNKHTELHDGAIIVRGNRLAAAACVLPLSTSSLSDRQMGLRHRAALGISEVSDAVAVVVSEETGQVSIAHNGRILRRQDIARLDTILNAFLTGPRQPDFLGRASSEPRA
ncbi:diadenylate cyclase CdaA [Candidatus Promineifilum breve]|uniref:diadenylate cyclase CdaA n=1 Tax=Candidatus Promineifilum breve TaxID=1806508 RepID=UPI0018D5617C|nr:diadenylate cyclase CdaA [Candidatus Promineifilum breve]